MKKILATLLLLAGCAENPAESSTGSLSSILDEQREQLARHCMRNLWDFGYPYKDISQYMTAQRLGLPLPSDTPREHCRRVAAKLIKPKFR